LALGFTKNSDEKFEFTADARLIAKLEKYFEVSFLDEIKFFDASGKAGELFEIPVAHEDAAIDRIFLIGVGDNSLTSLRTAGAALGKKVRGKALSLVSLCAQSAAEIKAHGVSLTLGAYQWSLKTGKTPEIPQFLIATKDAASVTTAHTIARALYTPLVI